MNDNEQREQLARDIFATDNYRVPDPYGLWDETDHERLHYAYVIADGLIAKGYAKTTTEATK